MRRPSHASDPSRVYPFPRLALLRFAQDAFTFFDMAFRAAALHGRRFVLIFCLALGLVLG